MSATSTRQKFPSSLSLLTLACLSIHPCSASADTIVNGACGPAGNAVLSSAPASTYLCLSGTATAITGSGPWYWYCVGVSGGSNATCKTELASTAQKTTAGVPLPSGWQLKRSDRFGTGSGSTVTNHVRLHELYNEGQFYNVDANGLVKIPNVVINSEQQTYVHFEDSIAFAPDHLTIQGRGHPDGSITSGEMVSKYTVRNFCVEARYQIPATRGSWPAFWQYGSTYRHDLSELDVEQPVTQWQGVQTVTLANHPNALSYMIADSYFTATWTSWTNWSFNASAAPHYYTTCYNDSGNGLVSRYIDAKLVYTAVWKWNASLGGTGFGADATTIVNLAVGGNWPGDIPDPASYNDDLDLYSIDYYGP